LTHNERRKVHNKQNKGNINILFSEKPSETDPSIPYLERILRLISQQKRAKEQKWHNLQKLSEMERQFEENDEENVQNGNDEGTEDRFPGPRYDETRGSQDWEEDADNEESGSDVDNDDNSSIKKRKNEFVNGNHDEEEEEEEEEEAEREDAKREEETDEDEEEESIDDEEENEDQRDDKIRSNPYRPKLDAPNFWMRELKKLNRIKAEETRCGGNCLG
jgi:hypothetical protein